MSRRENLFSREIVMSAIGDSFLKLDPRTLVRNPVIFIVELGSVIVTAIFVRDLFSNVDHEPLWFTATVGIWLWLTVLFANFAEAIGATVRLRRNLLIYGGGGLILPFIAIKLIDLVVHNLLGRVTWPVATTGSSWAPRRA